jgi:hypothetical protein
MTPVIRWAGVALVAMMPFHVALRPEHGWLLLSTCDVAAMVTAVALVAGWHRVVAVAFLFQIAVGLPAFAIGLCSTYPLNPTGTVVHIVPPLLGAIVVAQHGLPARAALHAWLGYTATFVASYLVVPAQLNINFAHFVWPPLARAFPVAWSFQAALLAVVGVLLALAELAIRRLWRPACADSVSSGPAPARMPPRGTARSRAGAAAAARAAGSRRSPRR